MKMMQISIIFLFLFPVSSFVPHLTTQVYLLKKGLCAGMTNV